jgi:RNA polymerase sigma-70 factor (ECF subfamily)
VERLQRPREDRFRALYADAYAAVLRFVQRRAHASHAEDVVADAFLVAWRRLDDAPERADDLRAWLFGIARNCLLNLHRGQERRDALAVRLAETALPPSAEGVDDQARLIDQRLDLVAAWRQLSAAEQEVLALAWLEDLASPQAAGVLGITATAYRLRLLRARRALRRHLDSAEASTTQIGTQL